MEGAGALCPDGRFHQLGRKSAAHGDPWARQVVHRSAIPVLVEPGSTVMSQTPNGSDHQDPSVVPRPHVGQQQLAEPDRPEHVEARRLVDALDGQALQRTVLALPGVVVQDVDARDEQGAVASAGVVPR